MLKARCITEHRTTVRSIDISRDCLTRNFVPSNPAKKVIRYWVKTQKAETSNNAYALAVDYGHSRRNKQFLAEADFEKVSFVKANPVELGSAALSVALHSLCLGVEATQPAHEVGQYGFGEPAPLLTRQGQTVLMKAVVSLSD
ncbi:hypothetical protein PENSUB_9270 [Penicillium subrubescens]|uniref:Uncharacterized protein n=1 Tax=Penicillium subrubescens TaxID=1316194 RepID=A0A1Q5TD70_9EURO|nr:hypothetical protein PENSUB_9270 [Penicillium subrubescens]